MKLYVGDYLGDTQHLSCLEHGAYMLLIMAYWQNKGPIKSDATALRRYTRTTLKEYKKWYENVIKMFDLVDGKLVHKRIEKELSERADISIKNRNNAIAGWSDRKATASKITCDRNAIPYSIDPESIEIEEKKDNIKKDIDRARFARPSLEDVKKYCKERNNSVDPERFIDHYNSNGWKVGKNSMKDWRAAVRTWEKNEKPKVKEPLCSLPIFEPDPAMKALVDRTYQEAGGEDGNA